MERRVMLACAATLLGAALASAEPAVNAPPAGDHAVRPPPVSLPAEAAAPSACPASFCDASCGGPSDRVWADAEYLLWWVRGSALPPLVSTSPAGTPIDQAGVLGTPVAAVLFGDSHVNNDARSGARFAVGGWFDDCHTCGAEAYFFVLEGKAARFAAASNGSPILARPFIDATTGQPAAERIAFPGDVAGAIAASDATDPLIGAGVLFRERLPCHPCCGCGSLDLLAGYRYLRFADRLGVDENLTSVNPSSPTFIAPGTQIAVSDRFGTKDEFNGFDVGFEAGLRRGPWTVSLLGKIAVGYTHQAVDIGGITTVTVPGGAPAVSAGGLLALPTNSGHFSRDEVSVVPEFGLKAAYQATPRLRLTLGYTYLFWENVVRAGDQVDLLVNPNLIPPAVSPVTGPLRPAFSFQRTNLWAQGLSLGAEFRY
jgi:hypothetical protein